MTKRTKQYDIEQCRLYGIRGKGELSRALLISEGDLSKLLDSVSYRTFKVAKKDAATTRTISDPVDKLKRVQRRILDLLAPVRKPAWVMSSVPGRSYKDNASFHIESDYVLTVDIKSFYENCNREYVYRFFKERLKMAGDIAGIMTDLCTWGGGLPTGGPSSQMLAYYAYEKMFEEVYEMALKHNCLFSLYVDDMTFSSKGSFSPDSLESSIDRVLRKYGHRLKRKKTRYYSKKDNKLITGVAVTPDHKLRTANALQHRVKTNYSKFRKTPSYHLGCVVAGQIQAARFIEPGKFPEIGRKVKEVL